MKRHIRILAVLLCTAALPAVSMADIFRVDTYKEIAKTTEKSLTVNINGSFETIYITKGASDKVVTISRKSDRHSSSDVYMDYTISGGVGHLEIDLDRHSDKSDRYNPHQPVAKASFHGGDEDDWYITFSDAIPIDFDLEFDVGKADLNLTGLQISRLNLATGASKVTVRSYQQNQQVIENVSIEAGVGKFGSDHLGNLNFRKLSFEGGIGSYKLDLTGSLRPDAHIDVEVGMGSMTMVLPKGTHAKLNCEDHWLNSTSFPRFVNRGDGTWHTENIQSSPKHLTINAECGVGSISVKWSD